MQFISRILSARHGMISRPNNSLRRAAKKWSAWGAQWLAVSLMLISTAAALQAAAPQILLSVPSDAPPGLERTAIEGGWRFTCQHAIADTRDIKIGTFQARRGQTYTVECGISSHVAAVSPLSVKLKWRDSNGKDAGQIDRQLGYLDPDLSTTTPADWSGNLVSLRLDGRSARSDMSQGELLISIAKLKAGDFIEVKGISISESVSSQQAARQDTLKLSTVRNAKGSVFFSDESPKPQVRIAVRDLASARQPILLRGRVLDQDGKQIGVVQQEVTVESDAVKEIDLPVAAPEKFGAYSIELEATVNGQPAGSGISRFAWLPHPHITEEIRHNELYPFDMHPAYLLMSPDGNPNVDLAEAEFQAGLMQRLGVRGIRQQTYPWGLDYRNHDASVAANAKRIETWKKTLWPVLQKHGIEVWISLMEQDAATHPHTPADFAIWHDYQVAQFKAYGDIPKFVLFGNEGLGGSTPDQLDARVNMYASKPATLTVRQWMATYSSVYKAVKEANPNLLVGPGHSDDPRGAMAQAFIKMFGKNAKADVWGHNCYTNAAATSLIVHNTLTSAGIEPKFGVIPEVGWNAFMSGPGRIAQEWKQAIDIPQTYLSTLSGGWTKRIDWFIFQGGDDPLAIFTRDWTPRPAAASYLVMADTLGAGQVEKRIALPGGGEFYVWRRIDNAVIGIGWAPTEKAITLDTSGIGEISLKDIYGNISPRKTSKGIVSIQLNESPVYVVGAPSLDESKALEVRITNATHSADGPNLISVQVRNNTAMDQTISVESQPPAGVTTEPAKLQIKVGPGQTASGDFQMTMAEFNDRVRSTAGFSISNNDYLAYETKLTDTFARCVRATSPPAFDGTWRGWERAQVFHADQLSQVDESSAPNWHGPDDLSAQIRTMWDDQFFYLAVETTDDVFHSPAPSAPWLGDAIEIGFDLEHSLSSDSKLLQFIGAQANNGNLLARYLPAPTQSLKLEHFAIHPSGTKGGAIYQLAIPWSEFAGFKPALAKQIGFGLIIDDSDGKPGDRRFISWFGSGIHLKKPNELGDLIFVK